MSFEIALSAYKALGKKIGASATWQRDETLGQKPIISQSGLLSTPYVDVVTVTPQAGAKLFCAIFDNVSENVPGKKFTGTYRGSQWSYMDDYISVYQDNGNNILDAFDTLIESFNSGADWGGLTGDNSQGYIRINSEGQVEITNKSGTSIGKFSFTEASSSQVNNFALEKLSGTLSGNSLSLKSNEYQFYNLGNGRYGIQQRGKSNIDEITGLTALNFSNSSISVANDVKGVFDQVTGLNTKDAQMYRLYNAAFARFPDANGLSYWISEFNKGVSDYRSIAQSFLNSEEFRSRYGANNSNSDFINNMYRNILGRLPDEEGRNYWVSTLDTGKDSRVNVLGGFAESIENKNLFSQVTGFS